MHTSHSGCGQSEHYRIKEWWSVRVWEGSRKRERREGRAEEGRGWKEKGRRGGGIGGGGGEEEGGV